MKKLWWGFAAVTLAVAVAGGTASTAGQSAGASPPPTFSKDVAPILHNSCATCHRRGEVAPMSLFFYSDARPSAQEQSSRKYVTARCRRGSPTRISPT